MAFQEGCFEVGDKVTWRDDLCDTEKEGVNENGPGPFSIVSVRETGATVNNDKHGYGHAQVLEISDTSDVLMYHRFSGYWFKKVS